MVDQADFKQRIELTISQKYKIEFLGKNFEQVVNLMTASKADDIYKWLAEVVSKDIQPIMIGSKKPYKEWTINQLLVFRYPFIIHNIEYRILFVKVKNSIYIEFHLGDHKYYDKVRKDLDLKKTSY
ncbi:hypothetical protein HYU06_04045 [Candidatus Woesearchaeota archaeon]|nr:hypothetical protein [Candidatus Woesearchaeota archaeon]